MYQGGKIQREVGKQRRAKNRYKGNNIERQAFIRRMRLGMEKITKLERNGHTQKISQIRADKRIFDITR